MNNLINVKGQEYRQLQRRTAKRFFDEGNTIYLSPCNMNLDSPWCNFISINNKKELLELLDYQKTYGDDVSNKIKDLFDTQVNEFIYYNCTSELGTYPHYFILNN